jgi:gamma-glutamyltranspeptidase/glutathione hydrolase
VAGGDLQDQAALSLLLNFIEFGMTPDKAVTAPRFATTQHQDSFDPNPARARAFGQAGSLAISSSVDESVCDELTRRGHQVERKDGPIAHPVMLYVDRDSGVLHAAGDPAAQRHAAGIA